MQKPQSQVAAYEGIKDLYLKPQEDVCRARLVIVCTLDSSTNKAHMVPGTLRSILTCWSQELPPALSVQPEDTQAFQVDPESLALISHVETRQRLRLWFVRIDVCSNAKTVD
jgi:hypothetical protein